MKSFPIVLIEGRKCVVLSVNDFSYEEGGEKKLCGNLTAVVIDDGKILECDVHPRTFSPRDELLRQLIFSSTDFQRCSWRQLRRLAPKIRRQIKLRKNIHPEGMNDGILCGFRDRAYRAALGTCISKFSYRELWADSQLAEKIVPGA